MTRTGALARSVVVGAMALWASLASCKEPATSETKNVLSNAGESWCPEGFESGPNDTCFAIPEHTGKDTPILVYLHGSYQGHGSPGEWSVVRSAVGRGFAVIVPRGKRGLCAWSTEVKDHFCWPQEPEDIEGIKHLITEWDPVLWQVDALLGAGTHKRFVLGFGNGGFFASFVATQALFPGQAYAVVNGGMLAAPTKTKPVPMLLMAGGDPDGTAKMKALHDGLGKASWNHALCPRSGSSSLTSDDVDAAARFFRRVADGSLRQQGAGYLCDDGNSGRTTR